MEMDNNSLTFFNATPSQVMTHKTEQQESEDHQSDMGDGWPTSQLSPRNHQNRSRTCGVWRSFTIIIKTGDLFSASEVDWLEVGLGYMEKMDKAECVTRDMSPFIRKMYLVSHICQAFFILKSWLSNLKAWENRDTFSWCLSPFTGATWMTMFPTRARCSYLVTFVQNCNIYRPFSDGTKKQVFSWALPQSTIRVCRLSATPNSDLA